jgi:outer membrane protein insertion porin family
VRKITFKGNASTEDEVLRREMRQLEGAWYSQAAIDRSKIRLQRLGFFKKVDVTTPRVAGTDDQVDVNITVEETSAGSFTFGIGYSQVEKLIASISVSENNFLGTGDQASATISKSYYLTSYAMSYFQPYLTPDGIGLGYTASYSKLDQAQANIANYLNNTAAFSTILALPLNLNLGISKTKIITYSLIPVPELDSSGNVVLDSNGNPVYVTDANGNLVYQRSYYSPAPIVDYINNLGHDTFHQWSITASWAHDTRNRYFNPTHGSLQQFSAEFSLPGSTAQFYKLIYKYAQYLPVTDSLTFEGSATVGYGNSYGSIKSVLPPTNPNYIADLQGLPFFENFYAGGISDVRNFRDNTLGPYTLSPGCFSVSQADYCRQPLGGNLKTVASAELIFPTPFVKDDTATRLSWYVDAGNVFNTSTTYLPSANVYDAGSFALSQIRVSTGISLHWQAPVGPIVINLGKPIIKKPGDISEVLQFNFGTTF